MAWSYEQPHNYATAVEDLVCFFNERVDITVDGTPQSTAAHSLVLTLSARLRTGRAVHPASGRC